MRDYIELTKPRITWLILMSTGIGYFFGLPSHAWRAIHWLSLLNTILGTGLIASGTAALNQWYERAADQKMHRTAGRPLPSNCGWESTCSAASSAPSPWPATSSSTRP
jgi:protoheme IX farnesyltransferase